MDINVFILDNNVNYLKLLKIVLEEKFTITATNDTNEFFKIVKQPAVIIVDWHLDYGIVGLDVTRKILANNPLVHCIYISADANEEVYLSVINEGWGCFFLLKDKSDFFTGLVENINRAKVLLRKKMVIASSEMEKERLIKERISDTLKAMEGKSDGRSY